jgi:hypothetical protein
LSTKYFKYVYVRPNPKESCGALHHNSLLGFTALCAQTQTKKKFESYTIQLFTWNSFICPKLQKINAVLSNLVIAITKLL